ncbi:hypothetical protein OI18_20660 [Flavihumibacter solisilvae]|uniref:histidine kinase n=2 Tax=Flavihumibacter solisilvae TaxID=1349421 RepID=A0A0C1IQT3_9BACT|nr:hypothetical protein OI18_20660 [Flavihumibacter solisilvae]
MGWVAQAQPVDTTYLKDLYDRTISFNEEKLDSIEWVAAYIEKQSSSLKFGKGKILANRLRGYHSELSGNYENAIRYYLFTLSASRESSITEYEIAALSDLAIVYSAIKQPEKAKDVYMQSLRLVEKNGEVSSMISSYCNIGAIYNLLNMPDSALYFLNVAHRLINQHHHEESLPFVYNNTGNAYFKKQQFLKALGYFRQNKLIHDKTRNSADLWVDHLNIGDAYIELKKYDSATLHTDSALQLAISLESKSKEADTYALFAKLYEKLENYRLAYGYQRKWYQLDTALVNEASGRTIVELQERFNASDRENRNRLLQAEVEHEKLRNKTLSSLASAAVLIGLLVGLLLVVYRRSNRKLVEVNQVIVRQKEKLADLNYEKNSLISIVSHDLGSPFASIAMWSQLLEKDNSLTPEQRNALARIRESSLNGERLIRNILEIEKQGTRHEKLELEEMDVAAFTDHLVSTHLPAAQRKEVKLQTIRPQLPVYLLTDQHLFSRILDNLVSNAIKFTFSGKSITVSVREDKDHVELEVADEGIGIPKEEQHFLFGKYAQLSARPTAGESSTGLGLSIVQRLVNELNGTILVESEPGAGTTFTVRFSK